MPIKQISVPQEDLEVELESGKWKETSLDSWGDPLSSFLPDLVKELKRHGLQMLQLKLEDDGVMVWRLEKS